MEIPKIFESEYRFCMILWENEPINSTELVKMAKEQLGWSKATTYTVKRERNRFLSCFKTAGSGCRN